MLADQPPGLCGLRKGALQLSRAMLCICRYCAACAGNGDKDIGCKVTHQEH